MASLGRNFVPRRKLDPTYRAVLGLPLVSLLAMLSEVARPADAPQAAAGKSAEPPVQH